MKIGTDIDDVLNFWYEVYVNRFGKPKSDAEITRNVQQVLKHDRDFWLNLPVKHRPNFDIDLFCTKRVNPKSWTKKWLSDNNISPNAPVYQMYYQYGNKADMIKGRVDVFIDDSIRNFIKMNLSGVPCLLMDTPGNHSWGPYGRIYSMDIEEITDVFHLFKDTVYPNFKELIDEYNNN